jgi:hypothetical protein
MNRINFSHSNKKLARVQETEGNVHNAAQKLSFKNPDDPEQIKICQRNGGHQPLQEAWFTGGSGLRMKSPHIQPRLAQRKKEPVEFRHQYPCNSTAAQQHCASRLSLLSKRFGDLPKGSG